MIHCYASRFTLVLMEPPSARQNLSGLCSNHRYITVISSVSSKTWHCLAEKARFSLFLFQATCPWAFKVTFLRPCNFFLKYNMESKDTSASFLNDPRAQSVGRLMTESRFHGDISHHRLFNKLFTCKQDWRVNRSLSCKQCRLATS